MKNRPKSDNNSPESHPMTTMSPQPTPLASPPEDTYEMGDSNDSDYELDDEGEEEEEEEGEEEEEEGEEEEEEEEEEEN